MALRLELDYRPAEAEEQPAADTSLSLDYEPIPEPEDISTLAQVPGALKDTAGQVGAVLASPGKAVADLILHPTEPAKDLGRRVVGAVRGAAEAVPAAVVEIGKAAAPFAAGIQTERQPPDRESVTAEEVERRAAESRARFASTLGPPPQIPGAPDPLTQPEAFADYVKAGRGPSAQERAREHTRRRQAGEVPSTPVERLGDVLVEALKKHRYVGDVAGGAYSTAQGVAASLPWLMGTDTAVGKIGEEFAARIGDVVERLQPEDPGFLDALAAGFGSMATFFIPGVASAKALQLVAKASPRLAAWSGAGVMAVMEAATEAGSSFDQLVGEGVPEPEAASRANRVFWQNMVLLWVTNRFGVLAEKGGAVAKTLKGAAMEGTQEAGQELIQMAQEGGVTTRGVVERAATPEGAKRVATAGAVGVIVGGVAGGGRALVEGREEAPPRSLPPSPPPPPGSEEQTRPAPPTKVAEDVIAKAKEATARAGAAVSRIEDLAAKAAEPPPLAVSPQEEPAPTPEAPAVVTPQVPPGPIVEIPRPGVSAIEPGQVQGTLVPPTPDETAALVERARELVEEIGSEPLSSDAEALPGVLELRDRLRGRLEELPRDAPERAAVAAALESLPVEQVREPPTPKGIQIRGGKIVRPGAPTGRVAPVVWRGWQQGVGSQPPVPLWNLTEAVGDKPAGDTVSSETIRRLGFEPPVPPEPPPATRIRIEGGKVVKPTVETVRTPALEEPPEITASAGQVAPVVAPPGPEAPVFDKDAAAAALKRLREKFKAAGMALGGEGVDFSVIPDLVAYGGTLYDAGLRDYPAWSERMLADIDQSVGDYLEQVFGLIKTHHAKVTAARAPRGGETRAAPETRPEPGPPVGPEQPGPPDQGPLETLPPGDVSGAPEGGRPGPERAPGAEPDRGRAGEPAPEGAPGEPGVGGGEAGVGLPALGERGAEPAEGAAAGRPPQPDPRSRTEPHHPTTPGRDYRITDADRLGEGGPKAKYRANVAAIRLLKQLEAEQREATPDEQAVLVKYVGWGGLKTVFDPTHGRSWGKKSEWADEHKELRDLLAPEEYEAANKTVLNAHYTSAEVVKAVWDAVTRLGFTGGRVLEPSAGIGHFLGLMPNEAAAASTRTAVELDSLTGRILKKLYPQTNVRVAGYETVRLPDNFFDLAISNVPFGGYGVHDGTAAGRRYKKLGLTQLIHDYFFAKSIDKVRPGGLVAFITSTGTMDKRSPHVREYLAQHAELVAAIRLPNTAFKATAGTEVTTDLVVLQKRAAPITLDQARLLPWMESSLRVVEGSNVRMNRYFDEHPEMLLGTPTVDVMYAPGGERQARAGLATDARALPDALAQVIAGLPANIVTPLEHPTTDPKNPRTDDLAPPEAGLAKPDGFVLGKDGKLYIYKVVAKGKEPVMTLAGLDQGQIERVKGMMAIRDAARMVLVQSRTGTDATLETARKILNGTYDTFVKRWTRRGTVQGKKNVVIPGYLNQRENVRAFLGDPDGYFLMGLEKWDQATGVASKTAIFSERVMPREGERAVSAETAEQALLISLSETNRVDWSRMAGLTGKTPEDLQAGLGGRVYRNPEGTWETDDQYLSGNVREKLAAARVAAEFDPAYARNVTALEAVQPEEKQPHQITATLGASWIEKDTVAQFVGSIFGVSQTRVAVGYAAPMNYWSVKVDGRTTYGGYQATSEWGTERVNGVELVQMALNLQAPVVYDKMPDGGRVLNVGATEAARNKQAAVMDRFQAWIWEDTDRAAAIAKDYNERFNSMRLRTFDGSHLEMPGMSSAVTLYPHQMNAIWRVLQGENTLLAHGVGYGKTYEMIGAIMESKRLGLSKKAMMVVPNSMVQQITNDFYKMYPAANLLVPGEGDLGKGKRQTFMTRIATGTWDAVIVPHSSFGLLPMSTEAQASFIREMIDDHKRVLIELALSEGKKSRVVRQIEVALARLETQLLELLSAETKDTTITFEELGVDMLLVDEAHRYKNLHTVSRMRNVKGLQTSKAKRAMDLYIKTRWITQLNGGHGVVFSTGTPISNTMAEMFTLLRYLAPRVIKEHGWSHFDAWAGTFGKTTTQAEMTVAGTYKDSTRFSEFVNLQGMLTMFRQFADVQMDPKTLGIDLGLPRVRGAVREEDEAFAAMTPGLPLRYTSGAQTILSPMSQDQVDYMAALADRADALGHVDPKEDNMLKIGTDGRKNALDPRLVNPRAAENPQSKANLAVAKVHEIWQRTAADRSTQLLFIDLSTPKAKKGAVKAPWEMTLEKFAATRGMSPDDVRVRLLHGVAVLEAVQAGEPVTRAVLSPHSDLLLGDTQLAQEYKEAIRAIMEGRPNPIQAEVADEEESEGDEDTYAETPEEKEMRQSVYHEIRAKLIRLGVPDTEIAFAHDFKKKAEKQQLYDRVNAGTVRILLGSTDKMGEGVNVQKRLIALHHITPPWKPAEIEQRDGRMVRQGNDNREVEIFQYVTEGQDGKISFDSFTWQLLEKKASFIKQALSGKISEDTAEDVGEIIWDPATIKALSTGNPLIIELEDAKGEFRRLGAVRSAWENTRQANKYRMALHETSIKAHASQVAELEADIAARDATADQPFRAVVQGQEYTIGEGQTRKELVEQVNARLEAAVKSVPAWSVVNAAPKEIGQYRGLRLEASSHDGFTVVLSLAGRGRHTMGVPSIASADAILRGLDSTLVTVRSILTEKQAQIAGLQAEVAKPFPQAARLAALQKRIPEIEAALGIKKGTAVGQIFTEQEAQGDQGAEEGGASNFEVAVSRMATRLIRTATAAAPSTTAAPAGPLSRKDEMIRDLGDALRRMGVGQLTLAGGIRKLKGFLGQYSHFTGNTRMKQITDVETFAHETGHRIMRALGIGYRELTPFKREMKALTRLLGVKGPPMTEGFAEFTRLYLNDPAQAQAVAPTFFPWFEARLSTLPDLRAPLLEFQARAGALRGAPLRERARAAIALRPREGLALRERGREALSNFVQGLWDSSLPLKQILKEADLAENLRAGRDPYKLRRTLTAREFHAFRNFIGYRSLVLERDRIRGGVVRWEDRSVVPGSKALTEIVEPIWDVRDDYQTYEVLRRIQYLRDSPKERHRSAALHLKTLMEVRADTELDSSVRDYERDFPTFSRVLDDLQTWNDGLLQYLEDSGAYAPDVIQAIRDANEVYVPLHRLMDDTALSDAARAAGGARPLKGIKGTSERIVLAPLQERMAQAQAIVRAAESNAVNQALADIILPSDGSPPHAQLGQWMDKVPKPLEAFSFDLERIRRDLEAAVAASIPDAAGRHAALEVLKTLDLSRVATVFSPTIRHLPRDHVVIWRAGTPEVWQVHDSRLLRMLQHLDRTALANFVRGTEAIWQVLRGSARLLRAGITTNPNFWFPNMARDQQEALLQSRGILPPYLKGILAIWSDPQTVERFMAGGGLMFNITAIDRETAERNLADVIEGHWRKGGRLRGALAFLEELGELSEMPTRIGVAKTAMEAPRALDVDPFSQTVQAAYEARESSIDFGLSGDAPGWNLWVQGVPFLRASLNAIYREARFLKAAFVPRALGGNLWGKETARVAILGGLMVVLEALLWLNNKDDPRWKELTNLDRTLNWIWITNPVTPEAWRNMSTEQRAALGGPWKMPRLYLYGFLFGALPQQLFEWGEQDGSLSPSRLLESFGLATGLGPSGWFNPLLRTSGEVATGYDLYRGRPIEPRSLEYLPTEQRATSTTSDVAKKLGQTAVAKALGLSPIKLDFIARGLFGHWTGTVTSAADAFTDLVERRPAQPEWTASDYMVLRRFTTRWPSSGAQSIQEFYDAYQQSREAARGLLDHLRQGRSAPEIEEFRATHALELDWWPRLDAQARGLSERTRRAEAIRTDRDMTPAAKRRAIDALVMEKIDRARALVDELRAARAKPATAAPR